MEERNTNRGGGSGVWEKEDVLVGQYSYFDWDGRFNEFQYLSITFYTIMYWYMSLDTERRRTVTADQE